MNALYPEVDMEDTVIGFREKSFWVNRKYCVLFWMKILEFEAKTLG